MRTIFVSGLILLAFALLGTTALAKSSGGIRPGWGLGDTNHVHTGPPGQSVRPGDNISQDSSVNTNLDLNVSANSGNNHVEDNSNGSLSTGNASASVGISITGGSNSLER